MRFGCRSGRIGIFLPCDFRPPAASGIHFTQSHAATGEDLQGGGHPEETGPSQRGEAGGGQSDESAHSCCVLFSNFWLMNTLRVCDVMLQRMPVQCKTNVTLFYFILTFLSIIFKCFTCREKKLYFLMPFMYKMLQSGVTIFHHSWGYDTGID